ncbi:MAG TPA: BatA domain-containing protein, partial [Bacteroidota bacterium]|nr:BatA domain-containing protein [Bacteroidota bacterium]
MTFLNPFMLFGLVAASVPLVIHLLNLRKLRTVDFSSLRFLKELQRSSIRRVKIRQWLLLAIRTLLIVTLVFAFARPALHGTFAGFLGGRASTAMLLLIDDSPSTSARNDRGEIFPQIRAAAQG